ncbi:NAD(P)-dependent oxidoreductase [Acidisoma cellulosilytica]|uniref:NAD(P)-dependent oxidoreductase n=1 Tax=Acidisoma cellulosilyticum TaxID=2802395 RepID=A0A964E634_9PROT|nr:NAD(P)-dependent oxidoreductase [Acidisoma cellulosilyticum]MCB8883184.1 NAD(P)-dependent oxidoreductase [Acidisoma cellulosilyticum]
MEKILVTGAGGLIGNAVRVALEARGTPVVPTDMGSRTEEGLALVALDLRDTHRLHEIVLREGVGAIVHCGGLSGPMQGKDNPAQLIAINTIGSVNMLEVARIQGLRRVVLLSSVSAYGHTPPGTAAVPEDVLLQPNTVYGASKAATEAIMRGYVLEHGVNAVALRPGWLYGPRRTTHCEIRHMLLAGLHDRPLRLPASADASRQFIHVDDMARAILLALDRNGFAGKAYTINGLETTTLQSVGAKVAKHFPKLDLSFDGPADGDVQAPFDLSAAERDLGFRPDIDLDTGIASYLGWMKSRL